MARIWAVWAPGGGNTAGLSLAVAQALAGRTKVLLAELPCLGIPRLGAAAGLMERHRHSEAAIMEYEKKKKLSLERFCIAQNKLALLAAGVFASPDDPVTLKAELETLLAFPAELVQAAARPGYELIIFECQGQLTTPMTFAALQQADTVLVVLKEPAETAFCLINIKCLLEMFAYPPERFKVIASQNRAELSEVMAIEDKKSGKKTAIKVIAAETAKIAACLAAEAGLTDAETPCGQRQGKGRWRRLFKLGGGDNGRKREERRAKPADNSEAPARIRL